jgi:hypothetical protein
VNRRGDGRLAIGVVGLAVAALATGAACVQKPRLVDFSETAREYRAKDYDEVYRRWTRHDDALHEVEKALEVWATFKSWDFREAYIEKYAAIYNLSESDRSTLRQAQMDTFHRAYEFHVSAQSANYKWNDLEKSSSAWRVTLVDAAGRELAPEYVRVERLPDAYESVFFPTKTPFTRTYSIRFAVPSGGTDFLGTRSGAITLRIASPLGRVELVWQSS